LQYCPRGDAVFIKATDNFKVTRVEVSIYNQVGDLIEQGTAVQEENQSVNWLYIARQENKEWLGSRITAVATDLPGNTATMSVHLT